MRRSADVPNVSALARRQDLAVPRAADHRAHPAVLRCWSARCRATSTCRAGSSWWCARRRHVGLAVHRAGDRRRARCFGVIATTIYNPIAAMLQERSKRLEAECLRQHAERPAGATQRLLGAASAATTASPSSTPRPAASRASLLGSVSVFTFDPTGHFLRADRGQDARRSKPAIGGSTTPASTSPARRRVEPRVLSARHQPDPRAGARKLRDARDRAVLATAATTSRWPTRRAGRRRLPVAIPEAAGAAVPAGRHGAAGGRRSACGSSASAACRRWF